MGRPRGSRIQRVVLNFFRIGGHASLASFSALITVLFPIFAVAAPKSLVILISAAGIVGLVQAARLNAWKQLFPPTLTVLMGSILAWMFFRAIATEYGLNSVVLWLRLCALTMFGFGTLWLFRSLEPNERYRIQSALVLGICLSLVQFWLAYVVGQVAGVTLGGKQMADPLGALRAGQSIIAIVIVVAIDGTKHLPGAFSVTSPVFVFIGRGFIHPPSFSFVFPPPSSPPLSCGSCRVSSSVRVRIVNSLFPFPLWSCFRSLVKTRCIGL